MEPRLTLPSLLPSPLEFQGCTTEPSLLCALDGAQGFVQAGRELCGLRARLDAVN